MFGGKRYGEAMVAACPFCGAQAYSKNKDDIPVCASHKNTSFGTMKCMCGKFLDLREGKWGPFFVCEKCGTVNLRKAMEMNPEAAKGIAGLSTTQTNSSFKLSSAAEADAKKEARRKNSYVDENGRDIFVRSDDPRFDFR